MARLDFRNVGKGLTDIALAKMSDDAEKLLNRRQNTVLYEQGGLQGDPNFTYDSESGQYLPSLQAIQDARQSGVDTTKEGWVDRYAAYNAPEGLMPRHISKSNFNGVEYDKPLDENMLRRMNTQAAIDFWKGKGQWGESQVKTLASEMDRERSDEYYGLKMDELRSDLSKKKRAEASDVAMRSAMADATGWREAGGARGLRAALESQGVKWTPELEQTYGGKDFSSSDLGLQRGLLPYAKDAEHAQAMMAKIQAMEKEGVTEGLAMLHGGASIDQVKDFFNSRGVHKAKDLAAESYKWKNPITGEEETTFRMKGTTADGKPLDVENTRDFELQHMTPKDRLNLKITADYRRELVQGRKEAAAQAAEQRRLILEDRQAGREENAELRRIGLAQQRAAHLSGVAARYEQTHKDSIPEAPGPGASKEAQAAYESKVANWVKQRDAFVERERNLYDEEIEKATGGKGKGLSLKPAADPVAAMQKLIDARAKGKAGERPAAASAVTAPPSVPSGSSGFAVVDAAEAMRGFRQPGGATYTGDAPSGFAAIDRRGAAPSGAGGADQGYVRTPEEQMIVDTPDGPALAVVVNTPQGPTPVIVQRPQGRYPINAQGGGQPQYGLRPIGGNGGFTPRW